MRTLLYCPPDLEIISAPLMNELLSGSPESGGIEDVSYEDWVISGND